MPYKAFYVLYGLNPYRYKLLLGSDFRFRIFQFRSPVSFIRSPFYLNHTQRFLNLRQRQFISFAFIFNHLKNSFSGNDTGFQGEEKH